MERTFWVRGCWTSSPMRPDTPTKERKNRLSRIKITAKGIEIAAGIRELTGIAEHDIRSVYDKPAGPRPVASKRTVELYDDVVGQVDAHARAQEEFSNDDE